MSDIDQILAQIKDLPPMPGIVQRLLGLLSDPQVSAASLIETVQLDQALTANILRVCNSAYFGTRGRITSLRQALAMLGNHHLLNIVVSQSSAAYFDRRNKGYDMARGELWRHAIGAALASQILVRRLGGQGDPMLYTAALLHDLGKVVLNEFVAEAFQEIKALVSARGCAFSEAEREVIGIDHAELGARICELWNFPPALVEAIRCHHDPDAVMNSPLGSLVILSDLVCMMMGIGVGADGLAYHGADGLMAKLGLKEIDIQLTMVQLVEEMQRAEEMLRAA